MNPYITCILCSDASFFYQESVRPSYFDGTHAGFCQASVHVQGATLHYCINGAESGGLLQAVDLIRFSPLETLFLRLLPSIERPLPFSYQVHPVRCEYEASQLLEAFGFFKSSPTPKDWDAKDQLIQIDRPDSTTVTYKYDGLARRIEKNVAGSITRYVYDGEDILLEYG